eukprot:457282_1
MSSLSLQHTVLSVLFEFYIDSELGCNIVDKLSIDEQLKLLLIENPSDQNIINAVCSLFYKLPMLKGNLKSTITFVFALSSYYKSGIELKTISVQQLTTEQLPLSLFIHFVNNSPNISHKANPWSFIHYLHKFCNAFKFNGKLLYKFWCTTTDNDTKTGFSAKFIKMICQKNSLKYGLFAKIKKYISVWAIDIIRKSNEYENITSAISTNTEHKSADNAIVVIEDKNATEITLKCPSNNPVAKMMHRAINKKTNKPTWEWGFQLQDDGGATLVLCETQKAVTFTVGQQVGYICDNGIVVICDVVEKPSIYKITLKSKYNGIDNAFLQRGFVVDVNNNKRLCVTKNISQLKQHIEQSHGDLYDKWLTILNVKYENKSRFEFNTFNKEIDVKICNIHPQIVFSINNPNQNKELSNFNYDDVLRSLLSWAASLKCHEIHCHQQSKLICQCEFKKYFYHALMVILDFKENNQKNVLNMLINSMSDIPQSTKTLCNCLTLKLKEDKYFKEFTKYIEEWLLFWFYEFQCKHCKSINSSIMINRTFHFVTTLNHCRVCGITCKSTNSRMPKNQDNLSSTKQLYVDHQSKLAVDFVTSELKRYVVSTF